MWDIVVLKKIDNLYLVLSPNGDTNFIDEKTLETFIKQKRVNYEKD